MKGERGMLCEVQGYASGTTWSWDEQAAACMAEVDCLLCLLCNLCGDQVIEYNVEVGCLAGCEEGEQQEVE